MATARWSLTNAGVLHMIQGSDMGFNADCRSLSANTPGLAGQFIQLSSATTGTVTMGQQQSPTQGDVVLLQTARSPLRR